MGVQEVMHQILSIKLLSSSFQIVTASLNGSRNIKVQNGQLHTEPSILDLYAKRTQFENDFPGVSKLNFVQFASEFSKAKLGIKKRDKNVVVKTYPNFSANPKGPLYGSFCRNQLLKFKPWHNRLENAWDNNDNLDSVYIESWRSFLNSSEAKNLVPDWSRQLHSVSEYVQLSDPDDESLDKTGEREEWMYLADLNFKNNEKSDKTCSLPKGFWQLDRLNYNLEQIGDMPYWINTQKTSFVHGTSTVSESVINVTSLNQCQQTAYDIVQNHFSSEKNGQLLMMIIGLAGSGKSYVINAIRGLLNNSCKVSAYFGIAAFNVNGTTLHSLLQLPIRAKRNGPLTSTALSKLQDDDLNGIKCLIIDE